MSRPPDAGMQKEQAHIDSLSHTYFTVQIPFDKRLVAYGYTSIKPYLIGPKGLELGSGDGDMTKYLIDDFEELTVVDASRELLDGMTDYPNLIKVHSLFEHFRPQEKYNTIVMAHILEHILEPSELLKSAQDWLAPDGQIIAIVPNALSFHRLIAVKMGLLEVPTELNQRDLSVGHRRVYTPESFVQDFQSAGLTINKRGGIFLKPMSNKQLQDHWTNEMLDGLYQLGEEFPDNAAEIYVTAQ